MRFNQLLLCIASLTVLLTNGILPLSRLKNIASSYVCVCRCLKSPSCSQNGGDPRRGTGPAGGGAGELMINQMTLKLSVNQVIIHTSGGGGGPIHYQTVVHSGSLSSVVAAAGLVTTSGLITNSGLVTTGHSPSALNSVVHSAALRFVTVWFSCRKFWASRGNVVGLFS